MEDGIEDIKIVTEFRGGGKSNVLVSVIMPVYNVAKYLDECMTSLVNQTLKDIEIICVDDGSTDNSLEILKNYAENDDRITIVTQENQRAPIARNNGFKLAKGKYVIHLDSDDFFELDMLELSYERAELTRAEICIFQGMQYDNNTGKRSNLRVFCDVSNIPNKNVISSKELGNHLFELARVVPWNKLYLKDFIDKHGFKFQNIRSSDDISFVCTYVALANRITFLNCNFVNYRIGRGNSIQDKACKHGPLILFGALSELKSNLISKNIYDNFNVCLANMVCLNVWQLVGRFYNSDDLDLLHEYVKNGVIPDYDLNILNLNNITEAGSKGFMLIHRMLSIDVGAFHDNIEFVI